MYFYHYCFNTGITNNSLLYCAAVKEYMINIQWVSWPYLYLIRQVLHRDSCAI